MAGYLSLESLEKRFGDHPVTRGVTLSVENGEIVALLGPSGSGKTTVLRLIAGFETPDAGRITLEGADVTRVPPPRRHFGMVFQHYALFPHLTVGENVAFGLAARGVAREEQSRRVAESLAAVELSGFEDRPVTRLSGGQQQRVALARALAPRPRVLLLDEPLSNLDPTLRERTRRELKRLIRGTGITTVFVTHEQEEAFDLGDRVAILHRGRLEQIAPPEVLYDEPATRFVATFVGRASVVPARWEGGRARLPGGAAWIAVAGEPLTDGDAVDLVVRPEGLTFVSGSAPDANAAKGRVAGRRFAGRAAYFEIALDGGGTVEVLAPSGAAAVDARVDVRPAADPPPRAYRPAKDP